MALKLKVLMKLGLAVWVIIPKAKQSQNAWVLPKKEWLYDHDVDHICYLMTKDEWQTKQESLD